MRFTDEMKAEDEKRWHARDIVTELGYCGDYMRDRKNMTNLDIRFYAYIMRRAAEVLKDKPPARPEHFEGTYYCGECGVPILSADKYCHECGRMVRW